MNSKPILFNGDMVRALLDGRKTQTRRVMKESLPKTPMGVEYFDFDTRISPYGKAGDLLWVRETLWIDSRDKDVCVYAATADQYRYKNGKQGKCTYGFNGVEMVSHEASEKELLANKHWKKNPSIFMPRWASRLTLKITDVRVERVQDISDSDALAEGIERGTSKRLYGEWFQGVKDKSMVQYEPIPAFTDLWDSINEKRGYCWEANPWVWVVEFEVINQNINAVIGE